MKISTLTFLFTALIFIMIPASAVTYNNGTVEFVSEGLVEYEQVGFSTQDYLDESEHMKLHYNSIETSGIPVSIEYEDVRCMYNDDYADVPQNLGGPLLVYDGTTLIGTGHVWFYKLTDHGSELLEARVTYFFDDGFIPGTDKIYDMYVYTAAIRTYIDWLGYETQGTQAHPDEYATLGIAVQPKYAGTNMYAHGNSYSSCNIDYIKEIDFKNTYTMAIVGSTISTNITKVYTGLDTNSKFVIRNSDDSLDHEYSYTSTNTSHIDIHNTTQKYYIKPYSVATEYLIYQYTGPTFSDSVGTIELNQSSYTDPELIQIDAELTSYDFVSRNYYIVTDTSEDLDTWHMVSGSYNATTELSSATISRTFQLNSEYYDLPIWIRATLKEYNPSTGIYTDIAYSTTVLYNPPTVYDYTLSGTVFDAGTYSIVEGATVTAVGPINTSATTSSTGRFTLYLAGGSYTITGSKSGFVDNVNEDIVIAGNISLYNIYLTQTSYTNGTMNGIIKDADTDDTLQDVHLIFTNDTDRIDAYTSTGGYYTASGFEQSTSYDIRAIKSGYYSYNGSVTIASSGGTHKSFDMIQINYSVTPTATVLDTYPDGEGHAWTNDEIITMLRIVVPGVFMMMFIFLLLAVLMGVGGNNGGNSGQGMGMKELWQR